jgi:hypothetical protein
MPCIKSDILLTSLYVTVYYFIRFHGTTLKAPHDLKTFHFIQDLLKKSLFIIYPEFFLHILYVFVPVLNVQNPSLILLLIGNTV